MNESKFKLSELLYENLTNVEVQLNTNIKPISNEILAQKITFCFGSRMIILTPIIDTDEINIQFAYNQQVKSKNEMNIFSKFIDLPLFYTWEAINTKGYFDIFLMSFNDLKPDFLILSEGGTLKILFIEKSKQTFLGIFNN